MLERWANTHERAADILRDPSSHFTATKKGRPACHTAGGRTTKISIPSLRSGRMEEKKKDPYFVKFDRINVGIFTSKHSVSLCNVNFH